MYKKIKKKKKENEKKLVVVEINEKKYIYWEDLWVPWGGLNEVKIRLGSYENETSQDAKESHFEPA